MAALSAAGTASNARRYFSASYVIAASYSAGVNNPSSLLATGGPASARTALGSNTMPANSAACRSPRGQRFACVAHVELRSCS